MRLTNSGGTSTLVALGLMVGAFGVPAQAREHEEPQSRPEDSGRRSTARSIEPTADVAKVYDLVMAVRRTNHHETLADPVVDMLLNEFLNALGETLRIVLERSVEASISPADWADIASIARREIDGRLKGLARQPREQRGRAIERLIKEVTTTKIAEAVIARWLGHEPPDVIVLEDGPSMEFQLSVARSTSDLALDLSEAKIVQEISGIGTYNGLVDVGEWVELSLSLVNEGPLPWFSTSAFLSSADRCTWVDSRKNHELAEMPPAERAQIRAWLFISAACAEEPERRINISLRDTHRTNARGDIIELVIRPRAQTAPRLVNRIFDTDAAGFSDGSEEPSILPEMRFELAMDVDARAVNVRAVEKTYEFPADLMGLFAAADYRHEPLIPGGSTVFLAADDLDVEVVGREVFEAVTEGRDQTISP